MSDAVASSRSRASLRVAMEFTLVERSFSTEYAPKIFFGNGNEYRKNERSVSQAELPATDKEIIMKTITEREAAEVAAANASGKQPVVFIHGLWLHASSWGTWRERFESEGYATVAVDWPGDAASADAA